MRYLDFFNRVSTLEMELREIEIAKFGEEPDETIIANLHASLVVDLLSLIARAESGVTSEGKEVSQRYYSKFENLVLELLRDYPNIDSVYVKIISSIREIYKDVLQVFKQV